MNKIGAKEIFSMTFLACTALYPGFGINSLLKTGNTTTLIAILVAFVIGFIPLMFIIKLQKKLEDENIFQYNKRKFKFLGNIINISLILLVVYILYVNSWTFFNFVISQFLTRNSYYFLAFIYMLIVSYMACKGLEAISRTSIVLTIISIFVIIVISLSLSPQIDINNLLPLFNISKMSFIKTVLQAVSLLCTPALALLIVNPERIDKKEKFKKYLIIGYILAFIFLLIYAFLILAIYGIELAKIFDYPGYFVYKQVRAFNFIERIENFIIIVYFNSTFINFGIIAYIIKVYLETTFKITKKKISNFLTFLIPIGIAFLSIYIFKNYYTYSILKIYPIFSWIIIILVILLVLIINIIDKRKKV